MIPTAGAWRCAACNRRRTRAALWAPLPVFSYSFGSSPSPAAIIRAAVAVLDDPAQRRDRGAKRKALAVLSILKDASNGRADLLARHVAGGVPFDALPAEDRAAIVACMATFRTVLISRGILPRDPRPGFDDLGAGAVRRAVADLD